MVVCEMCGSPNVTTRAKIEGVIMKVCSNCAKYGNIVERIPTQEEIKQERKKEEKKKTPVSPLAEGQIVQIIVPDFALLIKQAREKKGMKQKEFAKNIAEKESVIHNLESGKIRPNMELARKLEKALHIKLIEQVEEKAVKSTKTDGAGLTIGDIIKS